MNKKTNQPTKAAELRLRAEELARDSFRGTESDLYELRVHQIELEMQNEELHRARIELDVELARYFDFYNLAPVGYVTLSEQGLILESNLTVASMLGIERGALVNQPFPRFIFKEDADIFYLLRKALFETFAAQACDLRLLKTDGIQRVVWTHVDMTIAQEADGKPVCRVTLSDITARKLAERNLQQAHNELEQRVAERTESLRDEINERKRVEETLRESEARFRAVVEHSSNGVVFMSAEREIGYVSPTYPKFLGYTPQEMVGHFGMEYVYPEDLPFTAKAFRELLQTPAGKVIVEYRLQRKDSSYCWVETTAVNLLADPYVQAVVLNQRDISERKQAEVAQHDSEERYRTLAEATFEAIVITENGLILDVNKQFLQMLGYEMTEILGRHLSEFFIPEEVDFLRKVIASGKEMVREYTIIKKDGTKISIEAHGREILHSQRRLRLTTMRDVTERKLAREKLEESLEQQHLLSKHLQKIRENERAAVAREIHDELGQALTGLKMELYLIKDMQAKAAKTEDAWVAQPMFHQVAVKLTSAVQEVDATIDVVRNISTSLRPSLLDTLGLVPALEWLAHEFQLRSGIPCSFKAGLKQQDFSPEFSTAAFRICQEALTNVTRHAQASRVNISFKSKQADILLEVEDNGCGINEEALKHSNSLGILGMKERAYAFNGSVELKNSRTGGVMVTARFPASEIFRSDH